MKRMQSTVFVAAVLMGSAQGQDLLTNGDFAGGALKPWKLYTKKGHYGMYRKVVPGADWQSQKYCFSTKDIEPADPPALKFNIGALTDDVSFRNLSLKPAGR